MNEEIKETSIVIAVRNEQHYIRKCLDSLLNQEDYPHDNYEIIVIDGRSTDRTVEIVNEYVRQFPGLIKLLDNPKLTAPSGRNIGIKSAYGKFVMIFGGHSYVQSKFLKGFVETLKCAPAEVAVVGAIFEDAEDEGFLGSVMADVQSSALGGLGTSFKPARYDRFVDSVTFAIYRKDVFKAVGLHNEFFDIGQDMELNWRIRKAGYKILSCPKYIVYYYRRHKSYTKFSRRMLKYGIWKAIFMKKNPDAIKAQYFVPTVLLLSLLGLPILFYFLPALASVVIIALVLYIIVVVASSLYLCVRRKTRSLKFFVAAALLYLAEHFSFGTGFLVGLLKRIPKA